MSNHTLSNLERYDKLVYIGVGCVKVFNPLAEVDRSNIKVSELSIKQDID